MKPYTANGTTLCPYYKHTVAPLSTLVSIKTYSNNKKLKVHELKNKIRLLSEDRLIDFENETVFYRHKLQGKTYSEISREFCDLANNPYMIVSHHRVDISPTQSVNEEQWYQLIRLFLTCLGRFSVPLVVFLRPSASQRIDLFMLEEQLFESKKYTTFERWTINQMISIRLALWLSKPQYYMRNTLSCPHNLSSKETYTSYLNSAIYRALLTQKLETIHDLDSWLGIYYNIKISFQQVDFQFYNLYFSYNDLDWIKIEELAISSVTIRILLDFYRMFKHDKLVDQVHNNLVSNYL